MYLPFLSFFAPLRRDKFSPGTHFLELEGSPRTHCVARVCGWRVTCAPGRSRGTDAVLGLRSALRLGGAGGVRGPRAFPAVPRTRPHGARGSEASSAPLPGSAAVILPVARPCRLFFLGPADLLASAGGRLRSGLGNSRLSPLRVFCCSCPSLLCSDTAVTFVSHAAVFPGVLRRSFPPGLCRPRGAFRTVLIARASRSPSSPLEQLTCRQSHPHG